ncbi:MAG: hypothetical protein A2Y25_08405 [Candidatus Melainabacteria bacterium GWF2_37_15]|nr:MAG: hypothetical protein A2Y25_08405 [Candidatus Melainabacteria bacterium GWF2_37_15]
MKKKNKKILIISGKQYSGKDTVASILLEMLPDFKLAPLANALKEEFSEEKNLSVAEVERNKPLYRAELIELGNKRRAEDPDYWIKKVLDSEGNIIISDARLKHEIDIFEKYGAIKIRVESDRTQRAKRGKLVKEDDTTETDLDNYKKWDYVIENSGTLAALRKKTEKIGKEILKSLSLQKV